MDTQNKQAEECPQHEKHSAVCICCLQIRVDELAGALERIVRINGSTGGDKALIAEYKHIARSAIAELRTQPVVSVDPASQRRAGKNDYRPSQYSKDWHCAKCGEPMQFKDGLCWKCYGGDPGQ